MVIKIYRAVVDRYSVHQNVKRGGKRPIRYPGQAERDFDWPLSFGASTVTWRAPYPPLAEFTSPSSASCRICSNEATDLGQQKVEMMRWMEVDRKSDRACRGTPEDRCSQPTDRNVIGPCLLRGPCAGTILIPRPSTTSRLSVFFVRLRSLESLSFCSRLKPLNRNHELYFSHLNLPLRLDGRPSYC